VLLRRLSVGITSIAVLFASACSDPGTTTTSDTASSSTAPISRTATTTAPATTTTGRGIAARRPFESTNVERTYHRTAADGTDRTLVTEVWLPAGPGPFPLIAFAHGNDGHPRKFHQLFAAWASAGYAVVAPRFPVSADDADRDLAASVADGPEQNLDLEFVTAQAIAEFGAPDDGATGIDGTRLAVAGLSLGGGTALQSSYSDCCPGLRPRLVIAFSPVPYQTDQDASAAPLLLMHGTSDLMLPYAGSRDYFDAAKNRRWFVTMPGASHSDPYEDSPSPQDDLVRTVTVDFLDQFLLGDDTGVSRAESDIAASGLATIESAG
jgi:predicted dienelactone hydrolase